MSFLSRWLIPHSFPTHFPQPNHTHTQKRERTSPTLTAVAATTVVALARGHCRGGEVLLFGLVWSGLVWSGLVKKMVRWILNAF